MIGGKGIRWTGLVSFALSFANECNDGMMDRVFWFGCVRALVCLMMSDIRVVFVFFWVVARTHHDWGELDGAVVGTFFFVAEMSMRTHLDDH